MKHVFVVALLLSSSLFAQESGGDLPASSEPAAPASSEPSSSEPSSSEPSSSEPSAPASSERPDDGAGVNANDDDEVEPDDADRDAGALADIEMGTFRVESASPQGKRLGVGVSLGYPTAVTAKLMLRPEHAVDVGFGAFSGIAATEACVIAHADYLWHPLVVARAPAFVLNTHVGAGGGVVILPVPGKKTTIPSGLWYRGPTQLWTSLRVPVGVDLALKDVPVDVVLEAAPTFLLFPGLGFGADLSIGARVWW